VATYFQRLNVGEERWNVEQTVLCWQHADVGYVARLTPEPSWQRFRRSSLKNVFASGDKIMREEEQCQLETHHNP